jgi:hypothetical protein
MKPRLLLHIGTHKTGTSAIQSALHGSRSHLLEAGVLVPRTDRGSLPHLHKHGSVYQAAAGRDGADAEIERQTLLDEFAASNAHTMLITEEGLSEPQSFVPAFFAPWADCFKIEVICYVRRPDRFVESLYNQFVREAARREARTIGAFARDPVTRARLNYVSMLAAWQCLGAKVQVVDFDTVATRGALLSSFSESTGLPPMQAADVRHNPSIDMRLAVVLAHLNRLRLKYRLPPLLRAAALITQDARFPPLRHLMGSDARRIMLAEQASMMAALAEAHGVHFDDRLPEGEPAGETISIDQAYLLELVARASLGVAGPVSAGAIDVIAD